MLKNQIIKYVEFFEESLKPYRSQLEKLTLTPNSIEKNHFINNE